LGSNNWIERKRRRRDARLLLFLFNEHFQEGLPARIMFTGIDPPLKKLLIFELLGTSSA
jgi:hypothetical protein